MDKISLIEIVTKTDIDGYLFLKRNDTGQTVLGRDVELVRSIPSAIPISKENQDNGKYYVPKECVPEDANAIAYLITRITENQFIHQTYFCKLTLRPDDGIRTMTYVEPHDTIISKMIITFNPGVLDRII